MTSNSFYKLMSKTQFAKDDFIMAAFVSFTPKNRSQKNVSKCGHTSIFL